jgi:hypothetical protein
MSTHIDMAAHMNLAAEFTLYIYIAGLVRDLRDPRRRGPQ